MKKVIVSGVTGQDGSYMVDYLLANTDHKIYGMVRHTSIFNDKNIKHILGNPRFEIVKADSTDFVSISYLIDKIKPDYFINFSGQSFVMESWTTPVNTFITNALGVLYCLESIRQYQPKCRFYSAGSSEEWGDVDYSPQDIRHPLKPRSPYGASKASACLLAKVYRESYNLYAIHGKLLNHESERRGNLFISKKITQGVARIHNAINKGIAFEALEIGNVESSRDWSHAEDFCDGIWRMLNQEYYNSKLDKYDICNYEDIVSSLKEYVLSSGESHTVREFVGKAFHYVGIDGCWIKGNKPTDEVYLTNEEYCRPLVKINSKFYRPAEVDTLCGDSNPIRTELGWTPKISFDELIKRMVDNDVRELIK